MVRTDYPEPLDGHVRKIVSRFDTNRREAFEERAAIVEEGIQRGARSALNGRKGVRIVATITCEMQKKMYERLTTRT